MPLYRYTAYSQVGKKFEGIVEADSYELAKERLKKQQILIKSLILQTKSTKEIALSAFHLLNFSRDLAQLLKAGLPLYQCLQSIEEKYVKHKAHSLLLDLCDQLKSGSSLSVALKRYPKTFDEVYISMVEAAEATGALADVFDQLTILLNKRQALKKQLSSAMLYPAFLGCFCLIVVGLLLFYIVPSMQELFEGRALHPMTQFVLSLSDWLRGNIVYLALFLFTSVSLIISACRREKGKMFLQKIVLHLPFIKTICMQSSLIRFSRSLAILLSGGVPLLRGVQLAKNMMHFQVYSQLITRVEEHLIEGKRMSDGLIDSPLIPALMIRMIKTAEETGNLGSMLINVSEIYESEMEKNLQQLTTLLQPALLLLLGIIVGFILLAVLLPLTDVSSFMS